MQGIETTLSPADRLEVRDLRQQDWIWTSKALLFSDEIDGNTFKVYSGLAAYADNRTQESFPSIPTLSVKLHMDRKTVIRCLQRLQDSGFISVERETGKHNVYALLRVVGEHTPKPKLIKGKEQAASGHWVKEVLMWAEGRKQAKFVNYGKQIGALGKMQKSNYTPEEIKGCYVLMEQEEFWRGRGFDFTNVANELPKKITKIRQRYGTPAFDHLVSR